MALSFKHVLSLCKHYCMDRVVTNVARIYGPIPLEIGNPTFCYMKKKETKSILKDKVMHGCFKHVFITLR